MQTNVALALDQLCGVSDTAQPVQATWRLQVHLLALLTTKKMAPGRSNFMNQSFSAGVCINNAKRSKNQCFCDSPPGAVQTWLHAGRLNRAR